MTDSRLRELERRWRETGSAEDEAAWLSERLRVGVLSREHLVLAAKLGHLAALRVAADVEEEDEDDWWEESGLLWDAVELLGPMLPARAACQWVEPAVRFFEGERPEDPRLRAALEATQAWLVCPCEAHQEAAQAAGEVAEALSEELPVGRYSVAAAAAAALTDATHPDTDRATNAAQSAAIDAAAVAQRPEEARWQRSIVAKLLLGLD